MPPPAPINPKVFEALELKSTIVLGPTHFRTISVRPKWSEDTGMYRCRCIGKGTLCRHIRTQLLGHPVTQNNFLDFRPDTPAFARDISRPIPFTSEVCIYLRFVPLEVGGGIIFSGRELSAPTGSQGASVIVCADDTVISIVNKLRSFYAALPTFQIVRSKLINLKMPPCPSSNHSKMDNAKLATRLRHAIEEAITEAVNPGDDELFLAEVLDDFALTETFYLQHYDKCYECGNKVYVPDPGDIPRL